MPKFKALPPLEELQNLFVYEPSTGLLRYRSSGRIAGTPAPNGYIRLSINRSKYAAHRIIWCLITGKDPGNFEVDHEDRCRSNNRLDNLRIATVYQNRGNRQHKGCYYNKRKGKYQSSIQYEGQYYFLGLFSTAEEAEAAYRSKAVELRGEFAPAEYDRRLLDSSPG